jgi:hypothetical protein
MRILRIVGSGHLVCGCFIGVYETYDGRILPVVDESGRNCRDPRHKPGRAVGELRDEISPVAFTRTVGRSAARGVH